MNESFRVGQFVQLRQEAYEKAYMLPTKTLPPVPRHIRGLGTVVELFYSTGQTPCAKVFFHQSGREVRLLLKMLEIVS